MKKITIAIDGPAGSGKSTSARRVAETLRYTYLDTGAMYRAITLAVLEKGVSIHTEEVAPLLEHISIRVMPSASGQRTFLGDRDVSERIRESDVTANVSAVSAIPEVRRRLVAIQQEIGRAGGIVMDGRDIGTVVFPNAELKIFLIASIEERARRRMIESSELTDRDPSEVARELQERDHKDSTREVSPLVKAPDAVEIDTSHCTIDEQVARIIDLANQRLADGNH